MVGSITITFIAALPRSLNVVTDLANVLALNASAVKRFAGVSTIQRSQCWSSLLSAKSGFADITTIGSKAASIGAISNVYSVRGILRFVSEFLLSPCCRYAGGFMALRQTFKSCG